MNASNILRQEKDEFMHSQSSEEEIRANGRRNRNDERHLTRTLIWVGVAGLSAALAFTVLRSLLTRQPIDPTSQRIQQLIDEANQLLKTLDEQKRTG